MKPLIYGYLRLTDETRDEETRQAEQELRQFAEDDGFCLGTIFHDCDDGSYAAFNELTEELQRAGAHRVIVPSMAHLSRHPILRDCMLSYLRLHADACVLALDESEDSGVSDCLEPPDPSSEPHIRALAVRTYLAWTIHH